MKRYLITLSLPLMLLDSCKLRSDEATVQGAQLASATTIGGGIPFSNAVIYWAAAMQPDRYENSCWYSFDVAIDDFLSPQNKVAYLNLKQSVLEPPTNQDNLDEAASPITNNQALIFYLKEKTDSMTKIAALRGLLNDANSVTEIPINASAFFSSLTPPENSELIFLPNEMAHYVIVASSIGNIAKNNTDELNTGKDMMNTRLNALSNEQKSQYHGQSNCPFAFDAFLAGRRDLLASDLDKVLAQ